MLPIPYLPTEPDLDDVVGDSVKQLALIVPWSERFDVVRNLMGFDVDCHKPALHPDDPEFRAARFRIRGFGPTVQVSKKKWEYAEAKVTVWYERASRGV